MGVVQELERVLQALFEVGVIGAERGEVAVDLRESGVRLLLLPGEGVPVDVKQWRGLATRYDKLAVVFRAAVVLNAVIAWSHQC
ncbi:hypothetical protein [Microbacterium karelineae]|uniref:hypothetical protein n=1 Tax=Microbacterium karelineae TaxID=2654283 RepID=UPI003F67D027